MTSGMFMLANPVSSDVAVMMTDSLTSLPGMRENPLVIGFSGNGTAVLSAYVVPLVSHGGPYAMTETVTVNEVCPPFCVMVVGR